MGITELRWRDALSESGRADACLVEHAHRQRARRGGGERHETLATDLVEGHGIGESEAARTKPPERGEMTERPECDREIAAEGTHEVALRDVGAHVDRAVPEREELE